MCHSQDSKVLVYELIVSFMHTRELLVAFVMRFLVVFPTITCNPVIVIQDSRRTFAVTISVKLAELTSSCPESVSFEAAAIDSANNENSQLFYTQ